MFQRVLDGIRASTGSTVRLTSLAAAAAVALFVTTSFLCAAVFILVLQRYGAVEACLAGAGIFFLLTIAAAGTYYGYKRQLQRRRAARSTAQTMLADPMLLATGLQIVRAVGIKRLLPILAIGGVALGLMASRAGTTEDAAAEPAE